MNGRPGLFHKRLLRGQLKIKGSTWHIDERFVRISGRWMYLFVPWTAAAKPWISIYRKCVTGKPPNRIAAPGESRFVINSLDVSATRRLAANLAEPLIRTAPTFGEK